MTNIVEIPIRIAHAPEPEPVLPILSNAQVVRASLPARVKAANKKRRKNAKKARRANRR